jgi:hypothetical protein
MLFIVTAQPVNEDQENRIVFHCIFALFMQTIFVGLSAIHVPAFEALTRFVSVDNTFF